MGKVYRLKGYEIPEASRTSRGTAIVNIINLQPDEFITAIIPLEDFEDDEKYLIMATKNGIIKRTPLSDYSNVQKKGLIAINLREDDSLIEVKITDNKQEIMFVTRQGQCIKFKESDARITGRASYGVIGMNLSPDDEVVSMQVCSDGEYLLIASEEGLGKRTLVSEFTTQNRGGKGVKCYKILEKTGEIVGAKIVHDEDEVMLITTEGIIIRMNVSDISVLGRVTSGVKLINLDDGVQVANMALVKEDESLKFPEETEEEE